MSDFHTYPAGSYKGLEYEWDWDTNQVRVLLNGEEVFLWNNNAQQDCPEDLCWMRLLKNIFEAGVECGINMREEDHK